VDRLNYVAGQTLLKLVEEPPNHLKVVFVTDRLYALPPTIPSRSTILPLMAPNRSEIEELLRLRGVDEPTWRAQASGGDADIAAELDVDLTKEWHKTWQISLAGTPPSPDLPFVWAEKLAEASEATTVALWELLVQLASKRPDHKNWRAVGLAALQERERARMGKSNKISLSTVLAKVYAHAKTFSENT
jgi:hypothetical protein